MSKIPFFSDNPMRVKAAIFRSVWDIFKRPNLLNDVNALLFSIKSFTAAMLAYYIALRIGLAKPSWAIITVYIVSQTSVGASLSRGVYRLAGTLVGAGATVVIIPHFVNYPIICSVVLAGWIAFCLYFSLIERTPRAYAFVLAGYTASLIGFPAVFDPGSIFDTAIVRVQEIMIGTLSATLIHRYVLPKRITGLFNSTLSATLRDARQWVGNALNGAAEKEGIPYHLPLTLHSMQALGTHLPYDFADTATRRDNRRFLHDRLARLLPLIAELGDRLQLLNNARGNKPETLRILLVDIQAWLACDDRARRVITGDALAARTAALKSHLTAPGMTHEDRLYANLAGHLLETLNVLQQCDRLVESTHRPEPVLKNGLHRERTPVKGYVFHRDYSMAARGALGAFITIVTGCILWIYSAWPDGATAVSILGVCCTLFGSFDTPAPHIINYIVGSVYGVVISLIYSFIIIAQVSDFDVPVAALAPAFLFAGSLQARPSTTFMAMGITLTIPILSALGAAYTGDFAAALNTAIALFVATTMGVVSMSLLQTVQAEAAIKRLLQLSRRDIRRRALKPAPNEIHWTNLMIDRIALLLPRLRGTEYSLSNALNAILRYLRIGHAVGQLRRLRGVCSGDTDLQLHAVLTTVSLYFGDKKHHHRRLRCRLRRRIDALIVKASLEPDKRGHRLIELLIDLRLALGYGDEGQSDD